MSRRRPVLAGAMAIAIGAAVCWQWNAHANANSNAVSATIAAAATFEVYKDKSGGYRWRLRAQNSNVLATSGESYKQKQSCLDGIESVKKAAADAPVKELEDAGEEGK
jgi:uncharacterized protein YegP (UPF0339 family)